MAISYPRSAESDLTLEVCTDDVGLQRLATRWNALLALSRDPTVFQTWEWISSWWKHHGRGCLQVLVARRADEIVGILPLVRTSYRGIPLRQLRFAGAPLADVQDMIAHRDHEVACAEQFLAHLAGRRDWDFADLPDLREASALATLAGRPELQLDRVHHRVCPFVALPPTWDAFLQALPPKMRKRTGYYRRRLKRELAAEHVTVGEPDRELTMRQLFELHNRRWRKRGARGAFATEKTRAFHLDLSRKLLASGHLRLHRLTLNGRTAAVLYCFHYGPRVSYYLSGFDLSYAKYSIGHDLIAFAIEDAIALGASEFDFLRGDEAYKYGWNATERRTVRLVVGHRGVRSRVGLRLHAFERFLEHRGLALQRRLWGKPRDERE